jgi:hypothetical protein
MMHKLRDHDHHGDTLLLEHDMENAEMTALANRMLAETLADHTRFASAKLADGSQKLTKTIHPKAVETVIHRQLAGG